MSVQTIDLVTYKDSTLTNEVITAKQITELRDNVQLLVNANDTHIASRGDDVHAVVTSSTSGFAPMELLNGIDALDAALDDLEKHINNSFPVGGIAIWDAPLKDLPSDWRLCDGTNGTPDLRNQFVLGWSPVAPFQRVGTETLSINDSNLLRRHNHAFENICHTTSISGGRYAIGFHDVTNKWGQALTSCPAGSESYASRVWVLKNPWTTDTAGTANTQGYHTFNIRNPYVNRFYVMKIASTNQGFAPDYVTISTSYSGNGSIVFLQGGRRVKKGNIVQVRAIASTSYYLAHLYVNNVAVGNDYAFVANEATTVVAQFQAVPYQSRGWGSPGDYQFVVPSMVTKIRVTAIGAGGGAAVAQSGKANQGGGTPAGAIAETGESTTVAGITATGGAGGYCIIGWSNHITLPDNTAYANNWYVASGAGGTNNGSAGTNISGYGGGSDATISCIGGNGKGLVPYDTSIRGSYGQGGDAMATGNSYEREVCASGGGGGIAIATLDVTPGQTISIHVGRGGVGAVIDNEYASDSNCDFSRSQTVQEATSAGDGAVYDYYNVTYTTYYAQNHKYRIDYAYAANSGTTGAALIEWGLGV